jgi:hypothetical protein
MDNEYRTDRDGIKGDIARMYREDEWLIPPRKIEEYVRTEIRSFDSERERPELAEQIESIIDDVLADTNPTDPSQQSVISLWVRSIAMEEVDPDSEWLRAMEEAASTIHREPMYMAPFELANFDESARENRHEPQ